MLGLVSYVAAKVPADNAVPSRVVLLVELLLYVGGNVLRGVQKRKKEKSALGVD